MAAISQALQTSPENEIETLLAQKEATRSYEKRLRKLRSAFVSYDHVAPRVIDAQIALVPDAFGATGPYVTDASLQRAAESLGECGKDIEFAHKDVKRVWLETLRKLKDVAGAGRFKDLETQATVVANSKQTPDTWEPK